MEHSYSWFAIFFDRVRLIQSYFRSSKFQLDKLEIGLKIYLDSERMGHSYRLYDSEQHLNDEHCQNRVSRDL